MKPSLDAIESEWTSPKITGVSVHITRSDLRCSKLSGSFTFIPCSQSNEIMPDRLYLVLKRGREN